MKIPLITSGCTVPLSKFWSSVLIFHNKPNILNKKIAGVTQLYFYEVVKTNLKDIPDYFTYSTIIYEVGKLSELTKENLSNAIANILIPFDKTLELCERDVKYFVDSTSKLFISLRALIPKSTSCKKCVEVAIFNKEENIVTFYGVEDQRKCAITPGFPYHLEWLTSGHIRMIVDDFEDADTPSADWLVDKVFSKIIKWCTSELDSKPQQSLELICLEKYMKLYQTLKDKYGKALLATWSENTDPLKFIYEDIAIASYLICLWEKTNPSKKPTFLDLGCGNGLLVYILSQEGYEGYGIDVRERKIWKTYPNNVRLLVETIVPSAASLFPDTDWIIGNHSDELTPWIPVIAMRSSFKTNFFLLPCCSYDFSGVKYVRKNTSKSQYLDYLDYIQEICKLCGFTTKIDKLRIPSTKKISIISFSRTYDADKYEIINDNVVTFIENKTGSANTTNSEWAGSFKPRNKVEKVQNCTQLDRDLITRILLQVIKKLLEDTSTVVGNNNKLWNKGGTLPFHELILSIRKEDLKRLKDNCGGLQTLLRNHRYIFEVDKGCVSIRVPKKFSETNKYKDKLCYFFRNHPEGCPNSAETCAYKH